MNAITTQATATLDMPVLRLLRAYLIDAKYEALRMLRAPAFAIPFLVIPVPVYLLFGVLMVGEAGRKNPHIYDILFLGFSVMAVMGPAIFGVGSTLAPERDAGLMKLKRAMPAPAGSYIIAKLLMSMFFSCLAFGTVVVTAKIVGRITFTYPELVSLLPVMVLGALPFCALGLLIGCYFSGGAAPAITNLIYLPMIWLGGLFVPLPAFLQKWVVIWPAFHLQQVAVAVAGLHQFSLLRPQISVAVLCGITVVCGGLAMRRLARVG
jgi:ABC-2 type transport system permease protein